MFIIVRALSLCRGDKFRVAFAMIGTLRNLLPKKTQIMALSATATKPTYDHVVSRLSMENVSVVGLSPMRDNIRYAVQAVTSLDDFSSKLATGLRHMQNTFPKMVIFCTKYDNCCSLYLLLRSKLGSHFTFPSDCIDLQEFRLVDMYSSASTVEMKQKILMSLVK